jgi:hypothetical protein
MSQYYVMTVPNRYCRAYTHGRKLITNAQYLYVYIPRRAAPHSRDTIHRRESREPAYA